MTDRILLEKGASARLIISKVGYSATDPALADANKILDSDWLFGSGIVYRGFHEFDWHRGDGNYIVNFPAQPYVPAAVVYTAFPKDFPGGGGNPEGWLGFRVLRPAAQRWVHFSDPDIIAVRPATVQSNRILIPWCPTDFNDTDYYGPFEIRKKAFAVVVFAI